MLKTIWFQLVLCYYHDSFWHRSVLPSLHLYSKLLHMETQLSSSFTVCRICKAKMMAILLSLRCSLSCQRKLLTTSVLTLKLVHYTKATIPKRFRNFLLWCIHICHVILCAFCLFYSDFYTLMSVLQLLSHTPMVLEFLLQQSEINFDGSVQQHERNRKILRCLLSWVRHCTDDSLGFCIFSVRAYFYVALL